MTTGGVSGSSEATTGNWPRFQTQLPSSSQRLFRRQLALRLMELRWALPGPCSVLRLPRSPARWPTGTLALSAAVHWLPVGPRPACSPWRAMPRLLDRAQPVLTGHSWSCTRRVRRRRLSPPSASRRRPLAPRSLVQRQSP